MRSRYDSSNLGFSVLYLVCLGLCVVMLQIARAAEGHAPAPSQVSGGTVGIAIPPKPDTLGAEAPDGKAPGGSGSHAYTEDECEKHVGDLRDVCFAALARQRAPRDLEGAIAMCGRVEAERLRHECMADAAELHAVASLDDARAVCPAIQARKWRDQCFFGIATALVASRPALALQTCEDAGMWRDFCRHDVLGEASLRDPDWVLSTCAREEGDLLTRKTCWHGIGKYIGRKDFDLAADTCLRVPLGPDNLYRENCFHGLGWAIGERLGTDGLAVCSKAGQQEDSCHLGVAFQLKGTLPDRAVAICRTVQRDDLRGHCLDFVGQ